MKKKTKPINKIINKRANFDYFIEDQFQTGIVLNGRETKSLRLGHGDLSGSYVTIKDHELYLINASIYGTNGIPIDDQEKTRSRKLLIKKSELKKIIQNKEQGKTIIPLEILTGSRFIKVKIALAKGKHQYDKRQTLKQKEQNKNIKQRLKLNLRK